MMTTTIANLCEVVFYKSNRDVELLRKALNQVIRMQTGIRLHFTERNGKIKQYIKEYSYVDIPIRDFQNNEEFDKYASKFALNPIGLMDRDMYRFEIIRFGEKTGVLVLLSHLISDAWTFSLIAKEVDEAYNNFTMRNEGK